MKVDAVAICEGPRPPAYLAVTPEALPERNCATRNNLMDGASKGERLSEEAVARLLDITAEPRQSQTRWVLRAIEGPRSGREYPLPCQGKARLGRAFDNWICFDHEQERCVSEHHAEVSLNRDHLTIRDLGSTNGTRVNGIVLQGAVRLSDGDVIDLGSRTLLKLMARKVQR